MIDQQRQFAHGEQMVNPHLHQRQTPQDANAYMQPPQHDGRQPFMLPHDGRPPHATDVGNMGHQYPPQEGNWLFQHPHMGNTDMTMMPHPNTWGNGLNSQSAPAQNNQLDSYGPAGQGPQ